VFWVVSVYFNIRNTLPKSGTILLGHPVYRCLLKVLYPVSRPITILDCVPLNDSNRVHVARLGPEFDSRGCFGLLQGPRIAVCVIIVSYCAPTLTLTHIAAK
jgi:hypothetical protein